MSDFGLKENEQASWLDKPLSVALNIDWEKTIYIAFIVIAIISRFYGLGDRVVSHDESLHTQYSYQFYIGDGYTHTPLMHGPFLFHITAASYWLFGDGDFAARIPVALFGILMVVLPFYMRDWLGRKGALFASFMLLISPYLTYYSRYIRHDIYVIVWAMIVFIATMYYLRDREDTALWWMAGGIAMMYNTKEVSFIYVAIFGSFLIVRLLARLAGDMGFRANLNRLSQPLLLLGGSIIMIGVGGVMKLMGDESAETGAAVEAATSMGDRMGDLLLFGGLVLLGVALFFAVKAMRNFLEKYAEYDLIMLYASLLLPTMSALLIIQLGIDPRHYAINSCQLAGQEGLSGVQLFFGRLVSAQCWGAFFGSPIVAATIITFIMLGLGLAVGWWWGGRCFLVPALIFHALFAFFYTSVFTNTGGWYSGMVGSLAYWLDQQEVARGGQPPFYYFIVTPLYEFLPILFSFFAMRLWLIQRKLKPYVGFWAGALLVVYLNFSLVGWLFTRGVAQNLLSNGSMLSIALIIAAAVGARGYLLTQNDAPSWMQPFADGMGWAAYAGLLVLAANVLPFSAPPLDGTEAGLLSSPQLGAQLVTIVLTLAICGIYWRRVHLPNAEKAQTEATWAERLDVDELFGFIPYVIWWTALTWIAYSWAGEKMPWLSTHIAVPTIVLAGYYFGQKLKNVNYAEFFNGRQLALLGMALVLLVIGFITVQTLLLDVQFGDQSLGALQNMGTFFGRIASLILLVAVWQYLRPGSTQPQRQRAWVLGSFILLSLLTIRFTYMSNYVNGDYSNEFLVYAHGHPATKQQVLTQLEELSTRIEGDKSIRVSFDNKSSWPYYWYLRDYTNQHFFGENPDASITDSPVILAGSDKWEAIENIIRDDYVAETYSYIWWPMEEYRNVSWTSILGVNDTPEQARGLGSPEVRQALWDIFFYRDYAQYQATFGGSYTTGQWPLRSDLRMYIRRDVLGTLWDSGLAATSYEPPVDPYAAGEVFPIAEISFGTFGSADGQLFNPRNVAVSPDGRVYVADTGNHRIQVFNADGSSAFTIGEFGSEPGQINEPWGLVADENFLYVADTWNGRVQKFTLDGDYVMDFGRFEIPAEGTLGELQFYGPRSIDLHNGQLYIMDTGNHRIQIVDTDGNYISQVGSNGFALGQFSEQVGLAIDDKGFIYVAEAWNRRIQQLNDQLVGFFEWEVDAWEGNSLDNKPYVALDESNGRVYVSDPEGHQILIFNSIGEYLGRFGRFGSDDQSLNLPTGITVDNDGNVYVVDTANSRVQKFSAIELGNIEAPVDDTLNSGGSSDQ